MQQCQSNDWLRPSAIFTIEDIVGYGCPCVQHHFRARAIVQGPNESVEANPKLHKNTDLTFVSEYRNQHFVARHYLRRFSIDDGKRIHLLNIESGTYVENAPLKTQASEDFFYTKHLEVEKMLTDVEGIAEDVVRKLCETRTVPEYSSAEHMDLMILLSIMHFRTRLQAEIHNEYIELLAKRGLRMTGRPALIEALDQVRIRDQAAAVRLVKSAMDTPELLYDLQPRLIVAPDGMSFITSDHPVVFLNQAFLPLTQHPRIVGLNAKGLQIFLPLSPQLLLMAFDPKIYRVGTRKQCAYRLERREDCDLINVLQILNAEENVYFFDDNVLPKLRELANKFLPVRKRIADNARPIESPIPNKPGGFVYISKQPVIPLPGVWSFSKVTKVVRKEDLGPRVPQLMMLMEEHAEFKRKTGHHLSFRDWFLQTRHMLAK